MLKFIKHHMETIVGIEIYPIISFIIFFTFFIVVLAYLVIQRTEYFDKMSMMPFDEEKPSTNKI
ncbi:MAG TPA: CcoQ/FixQ family Cbb3-type cytochrome c oxidase assembly chaperone [Flavobacteriales bacterium]|nr:CcoQ/FixQ family Cbb3-type cytochrome c oxidase assembly chaperone [Flavobacteriales bacterium]